MKKQQLMIVLICVLASLILMTVFSKIQNNRIHHLRQTLDSLENGKQEQINEKFFSPESSAP
jgi:Na+/melibiose symporter-like transporter